MERTKNGLTRDQMETKLAIAEAIASLQTVPAWQEYLKAIDVLIQQNTKYPRHFTSEESVIIASRNVFIAGIKEAINLVDQAAKEANTLRSQLDKP